MDIWYQYVASSSMFYHEQGFDEFWKPGTTAAAIHEVVTPKGSWSIGFCVSGRPDRGHP
jgi:hypothetical protein